MMMMMMTVRHDDDNGSQSYMPHVKLTTPNAQD